MAISTAVDVSAVARVVGIETKFKDLRGGNIIYLPQRVIIIGQGSEASTYATTKTQIFTAQTAGTTYGFGSPVHLAALEVLPVNGDGVGTIPVTVYPLVADVSGVVSSGDITPSGTPTVGASYQVSVNNILSEAFVISVGDTVATIITNMTAAINANVNMPIIAVDNTTILNFTSKWKGSSANDIQVEMIGSTTAGTSFAITQPVGGLVNPDVQDALDQIGDVWETCVVNCMEPTDTTSLGIYSTFNEGRWGALTRKPFTGVFTGSAETTVATAGTYPDANKSDRTNSFIVAPGSKNLPLQISARAVARIAPVAQNNPAHDYATQKLETITAGLDSEQWNYAQRDAAVKLGVSTTEVKDNVINLSDTVSFYHPTGEVIPAYRYIVDIVKIQQILFNLDLIFASAEWNGAPLIPDEQPTTNPDAKKPRTAKAAVAAMLDSLGLNAIINDPETAKKATLAEIDSQNPKRLNIDVTVQLAGNTNIISIDLNFGFYFGVETPIV